MKKLYRSDKNKIIAGVFGGLGDYWDIDPTLLRLAWVAITLFTGIIPGLIAYIVAALIIPINPSERKTHIITSEREIHRREN